MDFANDSNVPVAGGGCSSTAQQVGLVKFSDSASPLLQLNAVERFSCPGHDINDVDTNILDPLQPASSTAIGDGLLQGLGVIVGPPPSSLTKASNYALYLLTDGENTAGPDPLLIADDLRDAGVQIFATQLGDETNVGYLDELTGASSGAAFPAVDAAMLPTTFATVYARTRGQAPLVAATRFGVDGIPYSAAVGTTAPQPQGYPETESFTLSVEPGARALNVMFSGDNPDTAKWRLDFELRGPNGELVDRTNAGPSLSTDLDNYYEVLSVQDPAPGDWVIEFASGNGWEQSAYFFAHVDSDGPDCYLGFDTPVVRDDSSPVTIHVRAHERLVSIGTGVSYAVELMLPNRATIPLPVEVLEDGSGQVVFDGFVGRGRYEVRARCEVGPDARFHPGEESTLAGALALGRPEAWVREATGSFAVTDGPFPVIPGTDCDFDGLANALEGPLDTDADGVPDACDVDSDGDDVPDGDEPSTDTDGDGLPGRLDPDRDGDGTPDGADPDPDDPSVHRPDVGCDASREQLETAVLALARGNVERAIWLTRTSRRLERAIARQYPWWSPVRLRLELALTHEAAALVAMGLAVKCQDPEDAAPLRATATHALTSAIFFKWLACESCRAGLN
jgi:hypothetical protein